MSNRHHWTLLADNGLDGNGEGLLGTLCRQDGDTSPTEDQLQLYRENAMNLFSKKTEKKSGKNVEKSNSGNNGPKLIKVQPMPVLSPIKTTQLKKRPQLSPTKLNFGATSQPKPPDKKSQTERGKQRAAGKSMSQDQKTPLAASRSSKDLGSSWPVTKSSSWAKQKSKNDVTEEVDHVFTCRTCCT